jgi:hypothetical protein
MKIVKIPVEGTQVYDMRKTRGYISIKHNKFYRKLNITDYLHWIETEEIKLAYGDTVWDILQW